MSDHDALSSQAFQLKQHLEQYLKEYEPHLGDVAIKLAVQLVMVIDQFPKSDIEK